MIGLQCSFGIQDSLNVPDSEIAASSRAASVSRKSLGDQTHAESSTLPAWPCEGVEGMSYVGLGSGQGGLLDSRRAEWIARVVVDSIGLQGL